MYLKRIYDENVGPIEKLDIELSFTEEGNPKPTVFVGENGSGKSILLSNIVDAFYEMAGVGFDNARESTGGLSYQYYKSISNSQIKIGENYLISYLNFENAEDKIEYIFKCGNCDTSQIAQKISCNIPKNIKIDDTGNSKGVAVSKKISEKIFKEHIFCFFPPNRYEKPDWQGDKYYNSDNSQHITLKNRKQGELESRITCQNQTNENLAWLLDIIADSRCDTEINSAGALFPIHENKDNLIALNISRKNIELVMSEILGENIYFGLNVRSSRNSRFSIKRVADDTVYVLSLDSLSTGQLALFNMFATIVRYSDSNDINTSIHLQEISGIVVIDEIELHLHAKLQREVLPKLIKLFPKVQFIITSHSPLFLLGMQEILGKDGFDIYEMPEGIKKEAEEFSEFQKAYDYMQETSFHQNQIKQAIQDHQGKTLVITEGASDWIHMKAALDYFKGNKEFQGLKIEFLKYYPHKKWGDEYPIYDMGDNTLVSMCKGFERVSQSKRIIFISDNDVADTIKALKGESAPYKTWNNNIFSMILPVPDHRKNLPISIEHYYSDEEIKKEIDIKGNGIYRRLFMCNEFNAKGIDNNRIYQCKKVAVKDEKNIKIIDDLVWNLNEDETVNYALSKMDFAISIEKKKAPFNTMNFDSFRKLFEVIEEICNLP